MDIVFHITQRNRHGTLFLRFSNTNSSSGWSVSSFTENGNVNAYIYANSSTVWNLYLEKSESYDSVSVNMVELGDYENSRVTIAWDGSQVTSLPSGYTSSTYETLYSSGGTLTGALTAYTNTNYTTYQVRNIAFTTSTPSSLTNGNICMVYS